jgi:hypothetical protein
LQNHRDLRRIVEEANANAPVARSTSSMGDNADDGTLEQFRILLAIDREASRASVSQVRASAWGSVPIAQAEFRIDDQAWQPMHGGDGGLFAGELTSPDEPFRLKAST